MSIALELTTWEMVQIESGLRKHLARLKELHSTPDIIKQTESLLNRMAAAERVTVYDPRE